MADSDMSLAECLYHAKTEYLHALELVTNNLAECHDRAIHMPPYDPDDQFGDLDFDLAAIDWQSKTDFLNRATRSYIAALAAYRRAFPAAASSAASIKPDSV